MKKKVQLNITKKKKMMKNLAQAKVAKRTIKSKLPQNMKKRVQLNLTKKNKMIRIWHKQRLQKEQSKAN